ncbi:MAG: uridine kinase [Candidatus Eisenbacteria bacterium]
MTESTGPGRPSAARGRAVRELADAVLEVLLPHPVRVAVDGVGASGKTVLADEIADALAGSGRQIIRAGVDGFHNGPDARYRRGHESPEGYYRDSFDHDAIRRFVVDPLGPDGDRRYRTAVYDFRTESAVDSPELAADPDAVLLFDGVFLLRSELRSAWDYSIFVDTSFEVTLERALARDIDLFGDVESVRRRYKTRYIPGERMYLEIEHPRDIADVVVVNDAPARPSLRWRAAR